MPRFHNVNGEIVPFTAQEEIDRDAEEAAVAVIEAEQQLERNRLAVVKARLNALCDKAEAGTITTAERNELVRILARIAARRDAL